MWLGDSSISSQEQDGARAGEHDTLAACPASRDTRRAPMKYQPFEEILPRAAQDGFGVVAQRFADLPELRLRCSDGWPEWLGSWDLVVVRPPDNFLINCSSRC